MPDAHLRACRTLQDDIKDSVRRAALSLARTVRGLTLRLADPQHTAQQGEAHGGEGAAEALCCTVLCCAGVCSTVGFTTCTSRTAPLCQGPGAGGVSSLLPRLQYAQLCAV